jgi:hypothetical protein
MHWEKNGLLGKARSYIQRAFEQESRDGPLFPFWATIGLEFLGRTVLAGVHPSLLADPQTPEAVLFACGIGEANNAKSVHAKTVFARCGLIVADFTKSDFAFCMSLMERRNEELHTAVAAFEAFPTERWLADYYRVLEKLLKHLGLDLADVLTDEDAKAAGQMVAAASKALLAQVKKKLSDHKTAYGTLRPDAITERRAAFKVNRMSFRGPKKFAPCPACNEECVISGETIRSTDPKLVADELYWESIVLPDCLRCDVCGLELKGHESLHVAELGGQFSMLRSCDAAEYYLEGVDQRRYYEEEYNNS